MARTVSSISLESDPSVVAKSSRSLRKSRSIKRILVIKGPQSAFNSHIHILQVGIGTAAESEVQGVDCAKQ